MSLGDKDQWGPVFVYFISRRLLMHMCRMHLLSDFCQYLGSKSRVLAVKLDLLWLPIW